MPLKNRAFSYIRMSTAAQLAGDSRRRQLEASRAYAESNGLELAESDEYKDIGVSAFRGDNVRDGALGLFLNAVESGKISGGSYLIVESLDRLSREEILTALSLFLRIIQAGINLVTLIDRMVYRKGQVELGPLIISLVSMGRAHDESLTKSHRLAAAWANKRASATRKPMTKWCPAWLVLSNERTEYQAVPERVAIVQQIFRDSVAGIGLQKQASRLNEQHVPTFGSPNGWHHTYIGKILQSRAVLGEFQAHVRKNGKRVPEGDPIKDYYPAIIDEELFYRAQVAKSERKVSGRGRKGLNFTNLFTGLASCAYCGSKILYENKGHNPKGGTYLICDGARRKLGCPSVRWRYRDFEASFVRFVEEVNLGTIVNTADADAGTELKNQVTAIQGELDRIEQLMEKTYDLLQGGGALEFIRSKLATHARRKSELDALLTAKIAEKRQLDLEVKQSERSAKEIKGLLRKIQRANGQDGYAMRAQIASHLKSLIAEVSLGSIGYRQSTDGNENSFSLQIQQLMQTPGLPMGRYFAVGFRNGRHRVVCPNDRDPLLLDQVLFTTRPGDPDHQTEEQWEAELGDPTAVLAKMEAEGSWPRSRRGR